jgi:diguanylate cyclase (GGDEF)-like protein
MVVFGLLLVIVGVTASAQAVLVTLHVSTATLNATVSTDAATVRTFVNGAITPELLAGQASAAAVASAEDGLRATATRDGMLRIEVRDPVGIVRLSSDAAARDLSAAPSEAFRQALAGHADAQLTDAGQPTEALGPALGVSAVLREYLPIVAPDGSVAGVVGIWRDSAPILAEVDGLRTDVLLVTLTAAAIVSLLMFLVFRAAQRRITSQQEQLLASTQLDPLTGLANHAALVAELAAAVEATRGSGAAIGVALLDVDNFKLVNETYGHDAGDVALRQVAVCLRATIPAGATAGRYGPDEFLLLAPGADAGTLESVVATIRRALEEQNLEVEASERIPITLSAGIAVHPEHAGSVTELLSTVALVLAEAKASGGNATRTAGVEPAAGFKAGGFDVLQGLVLAIDTKDRYTKRHSEDVARYGTFLARLVGLEPDVIDALWTAGLLHDVGKIGIPDGILRKPGKLTAAEYDVVKQHVALGEAIVHDVPDVDVVRAAIRFHHERWDGRGYLEELEGEAIPLVGRILAVADAFSAMTTTRPYRKALPVEEALRRVGDAAGTQLDERLAKTFIEGIETAADAPLPGEVPGASIWVPRGLVA